MVQYSNDKEIVHRNDIIIADNNRLAIIDNVVEEDKGIAITFIDNGFQCYIKIRQARFVNHNTEKAARSYRDLVKLKKH